MASLAIDQIRTDGGTQTREVIDAETVASYAEAMRSGATFPPVVVFYDGETYWLADGFHRVASAQAISVRSIECDVRQGDRRAAVLHSVGANTQHGLPRTTEDKRRAVMTLLTDEEWSKNSANWIAKRACVSQPFVAKVMAYATSNGLKLPDVRTGEDGRKRPAKRQKETEAATVKVEQSAETRHEAASARPPRDRYKDIVRTMHEDGCGTVEIAKTLGLHHTTVGKLKVDLGVSEKLSTVKLWKDLDHLANHLFAAVPQIESLTGDVASAPLRASQEDIALCIKRLREVTGAIHRLVKPLQAQRLPNPRSSQPPEEQPNMSG